MEHFGIAGQEQLSRGRQQNMGPNRDARELRTRSISIVEFEAASHNSSPATVTFSGQLAEGYKRSHQWIAHHENTAIKNWVAFGCPWPIFPLERALAHVANILSFRRSLPEINQTTGNIVVVLDQSHDTHWEGPLSRPALCAETLTIIFMPPACPPESDTGSPVHTSSVTPFPELDKSINNPSVTTHAVDAQFFTKLGDSLGSILANSSATRITVVGIWDWLPEDENWETFEDAVDEGLKKACADGNNGLNLFNSIQFIAVEEFVAAVGQERWEFLAQHATAWSV